MERLIVLLFLIVILIFLLIFLLKFLGQYIKVPKEKTLRLINSQILNEKVIRFSLVSIVANKKEEVKEEIFYMAFTETKNLIFIPTMFISNFFFPLTPKIKNKPKIKKINSEIISDIFIIGDFDSAYKTSQGLHALFLGKDMSITVIANVFWKTELKEIIKTIALLNNIKNMEEKSSEELLNIFVKNHRRKDSKELIDNIEKILNERNVPVKERLSRGLSTFTTEDLIRELENTANYNNNGIKPILNELAQRELTQEQKNIYSTIKKIDIKYNMKIPPSPADFVSAICYAICSVVVLCALFIPIMESLKTLQVIQDAGSQGAFYGTMFAVGIVVVPMFERFGNLALSSLRGRTVQGAFELLDSSNVQDRKRGIAGLSKIQWEPVNIEQKVKFFLSSGKYYQAFMLGDVAFAFIIDALKNNTIDVKAVLKEISRRRIKSAVKPLIDILGNRNEFSHISNKLIVETLYHITRLSLGNKHNAWVEWWNKEGHTIYSFSN